MVRGKHDRRVVELPDVGQRLEQPARVLVGGDDAGIVVLDRFFQRPGAVVPGLRAPDIGSDAVVRCGETKRPNLVLIFLDDSGYADFRPFGKPDYRTPNVQRLARRVASSPTSVCRKPSLRLRGRPAPSSCP